jgi:hypothetical protein
VQKAGSQAVPLGVPGQEQAFVSVSGPLPTNFSTATELAWQAKKLAKIVVSKIRSRGFESSLPRSLPATIRTHLARRLLSRLLSNDAIELSADRPTAR